MSTYYITPNFFTPNDDGDNDFWQIKNSTKEPLNILYIYNRYSKLIVQLNPNDFGWHGTYNGKNYLVMTIGSWSNVKIVKLT